jgi:hypothetical protein
MADLKHSLSTLRHAYRQAPLACSITAKEVLHQLPHRNLLFIYATGSIIAVHPARQLRPHQNQSLQ